MNFFRKIMTKFTVSVILTKLVKLSPSKCIHSYYLRCSSSSSQPVYVPLLGLLSIWEDLGHCSYAAPVCIGNFTRTNELNYFVGCAGFLARFSFTVSFRCNLEQDFWNIQRYKPGFETPILCLRGFRTNH